MKNHYKRVIKKAIDKMYNEDANFIFNIRETFPELGPADVNSILINLGWKKTEIATEGWECASWYYYEKEGYLVPLALFFDGYFWYLELLREDAEY